MVFDSFKEITCWVFERGMIAVPWETKVTTMKGKETTPKTWPVTIAGEAPKNKREIVVDAIEKGGRNWCSDIKVHGLIICKIHFEKKHMGGSDTKLR